MRLFTRRHGGARRAGSRRRFAALPTLLALALMPAAVRAAEPPNPMPPESVARKTLDNGVQVLVRRDAASPLAVVDLWVRAGAVDDGGTGAAHALEHMLFKGSADVPTGKVDAAVEAAGGVLYAETLADATHYWAAVPPDRTDDTLRALAQLLREPTVDATAWERERRVMMEEIARSRTDAPAETRRGLAAALFGLPYATPVAGEPAALAALDPDGIRAYYRRFYRSDRFTLVVVGPVTPGAIQKQAAESLGRIPRAKGPAPEETPPPAVKRAPVEITRTHGNSVDVGLAFPAGGGAAADVLSAILAGRLSASVTGIAERVQVSLPWQRAGILVLTAGGPLENEGAIRAALHRTAASAASGLSPGAVAAAIRRRQWSWWLDHERPAAQARALGLAATLGDLGEATGAGERLGAVSVSDVRAVAEGLFPAKSAP
jgi:zinc protease